MDVATPDAAHRILVVDDEADVRKLYKAVLEAAGYSVALAADGRQALERAADCPPDVVFLDLDMPRLGGFEVCGRLKGDPRTRLIPVVIVTGCEAGDARLKAWDLGADEFLTKPFKPAELIARCRSLLRVKDLVDELDSAQNVVLALARTLEAKSAYTQGHTGRVTDYALALARRVGVPESDVDALRLGAALHDLGKIAIPDRILDKPGRLTPEEYAQVKGHPAAGTRMVEPLASLRRAVPLIRWHHERVDGRGYPDGLRGESIPLVVRVLSVADVYDALSDARPYRAALPHAECVAALRADADGGGLDLELVSYFCDALAHADPMLLQGGAGE